MEFVRYELLMHPQALVELSELEGDHLKRAAVDTLKDLACGYELPSERLTSLPEYRRWVNLDLRGLERVRFDVPGSPEPRYHLVYERLPPQGDRQRPRIHVVTAGPLPAAERTRDVAGEMSRRLGREPLPRWQVVQQAQQGGRGAASSFVSRAAAARSRPTTGGSTPTMPHGGLKAERKLSTRSRSLGANESRRRR